MVTYDKEDKKLIVPSALGNFGNAGGGSGSGMTPEEVQEMIDTSIEENNVELDVEFEDLSERISGNTEDIAALSGATSGMSSDISALSASTVGIAAGLEAISGSMKEIFYFDVASYFAMSNENRREYWDIVYAKVAQGAQVYAIGASDYASSMTAIIPLVKYKAETDPSTHAGGSLYFSAKAPMYNNDTNLYFSFAATSYGDINGLNTSGQFISQSVYTLPVASDTTLGGVKVGSGLAVDANGVLSVSASTQDLENLSAATVSIRLDVNTLSGTTDNIISDVNNLSAAVSGVTGDVDTLSAATSGVASDIVALSGATVAVEQSVAGKQDALSAGNGIEISGATVSVKAGEGLGFSGDTLVVSGVSKEDIVLDAAEINNMSYNDRKALWDETYAKVLDGYKVFLKSEVHNKANNFAILPLVKYIPETNTETHTGGYLLFSAIDSEGNFYMYYSFSSAGNISGTGTGGGKVTRNYIYSLPAAAANTLGGVKVGSGLTISSEKLSVKYGDGLGMSGDTLVVSGISGGDGWQWISEDEYDSWTSEEKEAWYDNILDECWNNDNFKFGVYQVSNKTSSADTGYDQMSVAYRTMVLNHIEAGYNSLHFSGAEFGASDKNISEWNARIQRGGNWEVWTSSSSLELHASTFPLTSAGTAYGYFDSYNFNRCFDYAQTPGSYYAPAFNPILIYDGTPDTDPIGVGNVRLLANMTDGTVEGGQDIKKAVIEFGVPGGDFYRAIGYSVGQNQEGYDVTGWHLISCTQITF